MGYFVLLHIDEKPVLQDVINNFIEKNITFTISSNPHQLVTKAEKWYLDEQKAGPSGQASSQPKVEEPQPPQQQPQEPQLAPQPKVKVPPQPQQPHLLQPTQQQQQRASMRIAQLQQPSFSAAEPPPSPSKRGRGPRPLKRKREPSPSASMYQAQNQYLNAADLLGGDEPTDVAQPPPSAPLPSLVGGARVVRLVRSTPSPKPLGSAPSPSVDLEKERLFGNDEVIKNLTTTEEVDSLARTDAGIVSLMIKEGYIPAENPCRKCGRLMTLCCNPLEWRCAEVGCGGNTRVVLKNTWFSYCNLSLKQIFKSIILWGSQHSAEEIRLILGIQLKDVWLIENRIRETCIRIADAYGPLGGPGVDVQLGVQLIRTKTLSSAPGRRTVTRHILGGIEPHSGRCFLEMFTMKKPLYSVLFRRIHPGTTINGVKYKMLPSSTEATNRSLYEIEDRPHLVALFNRLKLTKIKEMIGETFPGYVAELMIRFNEEENFLKKIFHWLRFDMQPLGTLVNDARGAPSPNGDKPISEEERPLSADIKKEVVDT